MTAPLEAQGCRGCNRSAASNPPLQEFLTKVRNQVQGFESSGNLHATHSLASDHVPVLTQWTDAPLYHDSLQLAGEAQC